MWRFMLALSMILFVCNMTNYLQQQTVQCSTTHSPTLLPPTTIRPPPDCSKIQDQLERRICEVEVTTVFYTPSTRPVVVAKDISTVRYYAQRDLQGWTLAYKNQSFEVLELSYRTSVRLSDTNVFLCLGIHTQDKHCLKPAAYKTLTQGQRISQIHMLRDVLWRKDAYCYTMRDQQLQGWNNFTFPCYVLPQDSALLGR